MDDERKEQRRKLKGLQLILYNRADREVEQVFDEVEAYLDAERPERKRRSRRGRDREEQGGFDRSEE